MNFLVEAMQYLGIYFTPARLLALGTGDGKTNTYEAIMGNPPFGYRTIRYQIPVLCTTCFGSGFLNTKHGAVKCKNCTNGERIKWINEVRHVEDKDDGTSAKRD